MASQGAIAAAVIGAVGAVAAAVLAVVLPKALDHPAPAGGGVETTTVVPAGVPRTGAPPAEQRPPAEGRQVEAELFLNKESAPVGATVLVSGKGFAASEGIEIRFGAETVGTPRAGKGGDFANVSVKVPDFFKDFSKPMQVDIVAVGKSSIKSARLAFTIS